MELITHIYVAKIKPGTPAEKVRAWLSEIERLSIDGMHTLRGGVDLGLREGNYDLAITAEFADVQAWRRYDEDLLHNRIRAEHARPIVEAQRRVQFESGRDHPPGSVRNVTLIDLKSEAAKETAGPIADRLANLEVTGMRWIDSGPDLGLQEGNATMGVVCDFDDAAGYHAYDADEPHNLIRRDLRPVMTGATRVQFALRQ